MSTRDFNCSITFHQACRTTPVVTCSIFLFIRHVTRSTTEHNANPRLTIRRICSTGRSEFCWGMIFIKVWVVRQTIKLVCDMIIICIFSVRPMCTFCQSILFSYWCHGRVNELINRTVNATRTIRIAQRLAVLSLSLTYTNLTVIFNFHLRIAQHTSELTTANDALHDEGRTADGHISTTNICLEVCIRVSRRILNQTTAAAPYPAMWVRHTLCCHLNGTNLTAIDNNRTFTCIICT